MNILLINQVNKLNLSVRWKIGSPIYWLCVCIMAFTPFIVAGLLVIARSSLGNFVPGFVDEIVNWRQIYTFSHVGFNGGYYAFNELPAVATFTHFYTYGPWYPMLYGFFGSIFGWYYATGMVINILLVSGALLLFAVVIRPTWDQLILLTLSMATYWPLLRYLFPNMQEALQQSIAIILSIFIIFAITRQDQLKPRMILLGFVFFLIAALFRISWSILLFPFLVLVVRRGPIRILGALCVGLIALLAVFLLMQKLGSPGDNSILQVTSQFGVSLSAGITALTDKMGYNLRQYLSPEKRPLDILLTIQVLSLLGITIIMLAFLGWRNFRHRGKFADNEVTQWLFHLFNLTTIIGASLGLYLVGTGGDYRVIATHLMVSLLVLIYFRRYRVVGLIIASSLIMLPAFIREYRTEVVTRFPPDVTEIRAYDRVYTNIKYDPAAQNAWCNTVLVRVPDYNYYLLDIDPGIGVSLFWNTDEKLLTFKSRYLLLRDESYAEIIQRPDAPNLKWISDTPGPTKLYVNQDVVCES